MDAYFMAELNERLFTHFTRGAWRAPYSQRLLPVGGDAANPLGRIACADARDLARAMAALTQGVGPEADENALMAALQTEGGALAQLRAVEGFNDPWPAPFAPLSLEGTGPLVLLSSAGLSLARLVPLLINGAQRGMVWKPAPGAAASAHLLIRTLGPLAAGRLAMVQGDHATGAAMAGMLPSNARLLWASEAALPTGLCADLPVPALRIPATDPARP